MAADGPWRRERRGGNFQGKQCYRIGGVGTGVGGGGPWMVRRPPVW